MGRVPNGKPRSYQLQTLHSNHLEVFRLTILGMSQKAISERLDLHRQTISGILGSELGKARLKELEAERDADAVNVNQVMDIDVNKILNETAPEALEIARALMTNEDVNPAVRARLAMDLLGRAGHVAPTKMQGEIAVAHFTAEDIAELKRTALGRKRPVALSNQASAEGLASGANKSDIADAVTVEV